jgi:NADH-ubiquinone oxidoreductase chain 4
MGVVVLGVMSNSIQGIEGGILLSIAHGFVSSALFVCVGGVLYSRTHTRNFFYYRGIVNRMPLFTLLFLCFAFFNTGIPLTLNFIGEFLSLAGIWQNSPELCYLAGSGILLSALYTIFPYNKISYGKLSKHLKHIKDITRLEYFILVILLIPTVIFGIFSDIIFDYLHISVSNIIYNINSAENDLIFLSFSVFGLIKTNFIKIVKTLSKYIFNFFNTYIARVFSFLFKWG